MKLKNRIAAFSALGSLISSMSEEELTRLTRSASAKNNWFTKDNVQFALEGISRFLRKEQLEEWLQPYHFPDEVSSPKKVGVVMPGYIPLDGFYDFLAVLIAGHELHAKLSPEDSVLVPFLAHELLQVEPEFKKQLFFSERLQNMDAMIATPADNTSRYFESYFRNIPHIFRINLRSCAVLDGVETREELEHLGEDISRYYGLGSRSVSKLFVPEGYNFTPLFEVLEKFDYLKDHHKFINNYDYNKSIYLINGNPHLDTGFLLFKEDKGMISPISVVFYETYRSQEELQNKIKDQEDKIRGIVGHTPLADVPFGKAQSPESWQKTDKENLLAFLQNL